MGSRYRKPEEMRITLEGGDWLLVRKHLTAGEAREAAARVYGVGADGKPEINLREAGIATVVAYLIDWSITDANDKPVVIRDQSQEFIAAALVAQTPESVVEIIKVVQAHDAAMIAERAVEKKTRDGANAHDPTSTSVG